MLEAAKKIKDKIISNRRALHQCPELAFDLDRTLKIVMSELESFGYKPELCGKAGVTCTAGRGGKTILLRADMDALPTKEETGLPFSSENENVAHACGHDTHIAMLLGAAQLLKRNEDRLKGTVKFMFQPAEEKLAGAADMLANGILENPKVDAAMTLHIMAGRDYSATGSIIYSPGSATFSADSIRITVKGNDAHGSTPYLGVDAILVGAQIVVGLQNILAKEISCTDEAVLIVGKINGGTAENSLAGQCELACTTRATTVEMRDFLKKRIKEIAENTAKAFRAEALVEYLYGMPPLVNHDGLLTELRGYCENLLGAGQVRQEKRLTFAEDFCLVAERVPSVMFILGAGTPEDGYVNWLHHPSFTIDEEALPVGAAVFAHCAEQWLLNHS